MEQFVDNFWQKSLDKFLKNSSMLFLDELLLQYLKKWEDSMKKLLIYLRISFFKCIAKSLQDSLNEFLEKFLEKALQEFLGGSLKELLEELPKKMKK